MQLFLDAEEGTGTQVTTVYVMDEICRAIIAAQFDEGPFLEFPTMRFEYVTSAGVMRTFIAETNAEADSVSTAQIHLYNERIRRAAHQGEITIRNHFRYGYGYLTDAPVDRIGLEELMVREALCVGLGIKDRGHCKLVFALDRKDLLPVLELYAEGRHGDVPRVMRDLAVQLNAATL